MLAGDDVRARARIDAAGAGRLDAARTSTWRRRVDGSRRPERGARITRDDDRARSSSPPARRPSRRASSSRHRNVLANIVPVEREVAEVPEVRAAVPPDPLPEPAAAQPHVRPVDGDLHPADARRHGRLHAQLQPARHRPRRSRRGASRCSSACRRSSTCCASTSSARVPEAAEPPPRQDALAGRWWRYRRVHRLFGLKFWAFVVGAAPLDPELEEFWGRLGLRRHPGLRPHRDRADRHAESSVQHAARARSASRSPASR